MDCMEGMKQYPDKYFDLAIVDPPYGIGAAKQIDLGNSNKKVKHKTKDWDNAIPTAEYFAELFRVSKNQIVWGGNYLMSKIQKDSACWIFWDKNNGDSTFADGELAWTSFNSPVRLAKIHWCGSAAKHETGQNKIHPTQKPIKLYDWILMKYAKPNDLILDTHLGSGSSRIAAYKGGFNFVGFEIDQEYYEKQEKRFNDFKSQLRLF